MLELEMLPPDWKKGLHIIKLAYKHSGIIMGEVYGFDFDEVYSNAVAIVEASQQEQEEK